MRASAPDDRDLESAEAAAHLDAWRAAPAGLATETGAPREDGPGPSYRNILRAGFAEIEVRPNLASPPRGPG
jgi:hypothetical protein